MTDLVIRLADAFASAALENGGWMPALVALAEATGSARGQLIGIGGPSNIPFNWVNDFPAHALRDFIAIDGGSPLINPRVAVSVDAPILETRGEAEYRAAQPHMYSDVYADFCRDYDLPFGCQSKLVQGDEGLIGLAVLRTEREGLTTGAQRALFTAVAPHVRSAVRMQLALEENGIRLIAGALGEVSAAVFICAHNGRICAMTPAAEALLANGPLNITGNCLTASERGNQLQLSRAIARHGGPNPLPLETLILDLGSGKLPLLLDVVTAPRRPWNFGFAPKVMVIARGAGQWRASAPDLLQKLYGLSPAEADVAFRLAQGQSRQTIAEQRRSRIATVRSQIKSIFVKLGIVREIELVAMLSQLLRL